MKYIEMKHGKRAIVDEEDYDMLSRYNWWVSDKGYAITSKQINKVRKTIHMHRLVNKTPEGSVTDHINHDKLDNRKENLRTATFSQNMMNSEPNKGKKYKGVSYAKKEKSWTSQIHYENRCIHLGQYETEVEAARAYNQKAKELHGDFAFLNNVSEGPFVRIDKKRGISTYRGVSYHPPSKRWSAKITHKKKTVFIGTFDDPEDAARAYNDKAKEVFGEHTFLNDVEDKEYKVINRTAEKIGESGFRGVIYNKMNGKWIARFSHNNKKVHVGTFEDKIEAAKAYDKKIFEIKGSGAILNFPELIN